MKTIDMTETEALVSAQRERYPLLAVRDMIKCLYQSEFGCGHMVAASDDRLGYILSETAAARHIDLPVEDLGEFSRVHLGGLCDIGITPETLYKLFVMSAERPAGSMDNFVCRLEELIRLCPEAESEIREYISSGCPATHHSPGFRGMYKPAYRVIRTEYIKYFPVLAAIERRLSDNGHVTVAVDGMAASGKSTFAALLGRLYGGNVFHADDFFLRKEQRTHERLAEPGGNFDRERFADEIIAPLKAGGDIVYRPFDCGLMALGEEVRVKAADFNVLEGSYTMHPALRDVYDIKVFMKTDVRTQRERILLRNGSDMLERFENIWIPMENRYFEAENIENICDFVIGGGNRT